MSAWIEQCHFLGKQKLMFAVGVGNLGWMLVLDALMAIEKKLPWGRRFSAPLGVVLLC
jgi:predicted metal-binding membrane protein